MEKFECFDCGKRFDYEDLIDEMALHCPYCDSENVEELEREQYVLEKD